MPKSYLELVFTPGFHIIGEEILSHLSCTDINNLRTAFIGRGNHLIVNDCFFLFNEKIAPLLTQNSKKCWDIIIKKSVVSAKNKIAAWKNSKILCDIFFPVPHAFFYQRYFYKTIYKKPLLCLFHNQNLGGLRVLYIALKFCNRIQKQLLFDQSIDDQGFNLLHKVVEYDDLQTLALFTPLVKKHQIRGKSLFDLAIRNSSAKILKHARRHSPTSFYHKYRMRINWFYM